MRSALVVGLVVLATGAVASDLIVRQRSETSLSGAPPREETVYLGTDKVVTDSAAMRTIVDLQRRTITAADKTKRVYTVMTFDEITAQMDALRKQIAQLPPEVRGQMGPILDDGPPVTVTPTGRTETIAGYRASEYALKGGPYTGSVWATEAIPTPPAFQKWKALDQGGAPGGGRQLGEAMQKVKGFPLRTRIETKASAQAFVLSNEVIDVKEGTAPADVLAVPTGFTREEPGLR